MMENNSNKPLRDDHDQPPQDDATRNKIDKHLSDESDTISEEDIRNINTSTGRESIPAVSHKDPDEENEIDDKDDDGDDDDDDDEPKKEMPTTWDIVG